MKGQQIMKLRQQLQEHGYSHSFTTDEKGEFHLEALEPLIMVLVYSDTNIAVVFQIQRSSSLSSCTTFLHWILYSNCTYKYYFPLHL